MEIRSPSPSLPWSAEDPWMTCVEDDVEVVGETPPRDSPRSAGVSSSHWRQSEGFVRLAQMIQRRDGLSFQVAIDVARLIWSDMSEDARERYRQEADKERLSMQQCSRANCAARQECLRRLLEIFWSLTEGLSGENK